MCNREDCKAYSVKMGGRCLALTDTRFKGECPFYKTEAQFIEEVKRLKRKGK